jgi:hypothetical protein
MKGKSSKYYNGDFVRIQETEGSSEISSDIYKIFCSNIYKGFTLVDLGIDLKKNPLHLTKENNFYSYPFSHLISLVCEFFVLYIGGVCVSVSLSQSVRGCEGEEWKA